MNERIGRYELLGPLGRGGMAEVFLARQDGVAGFSKELVIKRVLPDLVGDPKFVTMFLDEARLAALLTHPNICQVFELGEADGQYFIAMERIAGRTLGELLRTARSKKLEVPLGASLRIVAQLCEALAYAHALKDASGKPLNLVHRDVTASNVMVTPDASVKLLDFGIARAATRTNRTQAGVTRGKLGFMAPEQVTAPQDIDHRADLFAVGSLLYLLTVGRAPYADVAKGSLLHEMGMGRFPPPRQLKPTLPAEVDALILEAMAPEPDDRFPSATELHRAVERVAMALGVSLGPHALRDFLLELDRDSSTATTTPTLRPVAPGPADVETREGVVPRGDAPEPRTVVALPVDDLDREAPTRISGPHDAVSTDAAVAVTPRSVEVEPTTSRMAKSLAEVTEVRTKDAVTPADRRWRRTLLLAVTLALVAGIGVAWSLLAGPLRATPDPAAPAEAAPTEPPAAPPSAATPGEPGAPAPTTAPAAPGDAPPTAVPLAPEPAPTAPAVPAPAERPAAEPAPPPGESP
jgi:serine/threonine-protein kinase